MRGGRAEPRQFNSYQKNPARSETAASAPTRTVIIVTITPDAQANPDVVACTVEAIQALPNVAEVTTRRVWARSNGTRPERTS